MLLCASESLCSSTLMAVGCCRTGLPNACRFCTFRCACVREHEREERDGGRPRRVSTRKGKREKDGQSEMRESGRLFAVCFVDVASNNAYLRADAGSDEVRTLRTVAKSAPILFVRIAASTSSSTYLSLEQRLPTAVG